MNINSADEEELPEPPLTTVLVIGRSSTGKTNLVRALLREYQQFDKITYVLNDRTRDWPYTHVYWQQVQDLANCQLVVEVRPFRKVGQSWHNDDFLSLQDIIGANSKQFK